MEQINQLPHLDATILEESSSSSQIIFCFTSKGDLCGVKQLGEGEIEFSRIMSLLGVSTFYFFLWLGREVLIFHLVCVITGG